MSCVRYVRNARRLFVNVPKGGAIVFSQHAWRAQCFSGLLSANIASGNVKRCLSVYVRGQRVGAGAVYVVHDRFCECPGCGGAF